jgi:hypothetical protein
MLDNAIDTDGKIHDANGAENGLLVALYAFDISAIVATHAGEPIIASNRHAVSRP